jgi:peroxiredoxin Q/BCP
LIPRWINDRFLSPVNPILATGSRAPAFTLPSSDGGKLRLTAHRGRWIILHFYVKDHTRFCERALNSFSRLNEEFESERAVVLAIGPCNQESHSRFASDCSFSFPLLSDHDNRVAQKYGVWREKRGNGHKFLGIVRTTIIVDPVGNVVRVFDNVRLKGHPEKVLTALRAELAK